LQNIRQLLQCSQQSPKKQKDATTQQRSSLYFSLRTMEAVFALAHNNFLKILIAKRFVKVVQGLRPQKT